MTIHSTTVQRRTLRSSTTSLAPKTQKLRTLTVAELTHVGGGWDLGVQSPRDNQTGTAK